MGADLIRKGWRTMDEMDQQRIFSANFFNEVYVNGIFAMTWHKSFVDQWPTTLKDRMVWRREYEYFVEAAEATGVLSMFGSRGNLDLDMTIPFVTGRMPSDPD